MTSEVPVTQLDVEAMIQRFRDRAGGAQPALAAHRRQERTQFIPRRRPTSRTSPSSATPRHPRRRDPDAADRPAPEGVTGTVSLARSRRSTRPTRTTRRPSSWTADEAWQQAHAEMMREWVARLDPASRRGPAARRPGPPPAALGLATVRLPRRPVGLPALADRAMKRHAEDVAAILAAEGYDDATIAGAADHPQGGPRPRPRGAGPRGRLCLVFLETQFDELIDASRSRQGGRGGGEDARQDEPGRARGRAGLPFSEPGLSPWCGSRPRG